MSKINIRTKLKILTISVLSIIFILLFSPILIAIGLLLGPLISYKILKHIESDEKIRTKGSINDDQGGNKGNKLLIAKSFGLYLLLALVSPLLLIALIVIGPFTLYKYKLKNIENKITPTNQDQNTFFAMDDEEIKGYYTKFNEIFQNSQTPFNDFNFTLEKEEDGIKYNLTSNYIKPNIIQTINWEDKDNKYIAKIDIKTNTNTEKEWFNEIKKIQIENITYQKIEQNIDVSDVKNTLSDNQPTKSFNLIGYLKNAFKKCF